jgi:multisubunit Na+/H+ antiporter MnhG subunit
VRRIIGLASTASRDSTIVSTTSIFLSLMRFAQLRTTFVALEFYTTPVSTHFVATPSYLADGRTRRTVWRHTRLQIVRET